VVGDNSGAGVPAATTFDIGPASAAKIVATNGTVTVPITLSQFTPPSGAGNGAKGFQVTVALSSGLKFAQSLGQSITPGPYLTGTGACPNSAGDPSPIFSAIVNTNNTVTIVAALNPGKCAQCLTAAFPDGGVVFNLVLGTTLPLGSTTTEHVTLTGSPSGAGTPSPTLRDCSGNAAIAVLYGVTDAPIVVDIPPPLDLSLNGTDPQCAGTATGSITANASGGTPPNTYSKDGITFQSSNVFPNLAAGPYTITVKDATGATKTASKTLVDPPTLTLTLSPTANPMCAGTASGSITANGGGGTPPYTYAKDGATFQTSKVFPNLAAGPFTITVKDANGCKQTANTTLTDPPAVTLTLDPTNPLCAGTATGSITANGGGGTPPLMYSCDGKPFQPSNVCPNLAAGPHMVTVKDANACMKTVMLTLVDPPGLTLTLDPPTNPSCAVTATGSITANGGGGTPPYTYAKDGATFQTSKVFSNLPAGPYTITVKDANGCKQTASTSLVDPPALSLTLDPPTNPLCTGTATGSITANGGGGTPPYTYAKDGATFQGSSVFSNLAAGPYTITVKDANGCKQTANTTLVDPPALSLTLNPINSPSCMGPATGSITANGGGGTPPYTYAKDGITFQTSNVFPNLVAGPYTITVMDANGCKQTANATLTPSSGGALALALVATPCVLWPPDCKLHAIHIAPTITGACGPVTLKLESITPSCTQDDDRQRKPDVVDAVFGTADFDFQVRARQCGKEDDDDDHEEKCEERCEDLGESQAQAACYRDCDDIKDRTLREQCKKEQKACEEKFLEGWDDHCEEECEETKDLYYTIVYSAMDATGIEVTASVQVRVQHAKKAEASVAAGPGDPSKPDATVWSLPLSIIIPSIPRVTVPSGNEAPDAVDHSLQGEHATGPPRLAARNVDPAQILIGNSTGFVSLTSLNYADMNGDGVEDVVAKLQSKQQLSLQGLPVSADDPITLYFKTLNGKGYEVTRIAGLPGAPPPATPHRDTPPPQDAMLSDSPAAPEIRATQFVSAYPNPSPGRLSMRVDLAQVTDARIEIYDLRGALIRTLMQGSQPVGHYELAWDGLDGGGRPVPTGLYLVRMRAGGYRATRSVMLVR
jgi:hypothetical protein